ncbi:hypothetical protein GobsT_08970 [Gemmata obscuriglobus]|nr:hypothetical protein GobsT_08970 [Gemmata obscuriglobus]VTS00757.1 unnamed protein product [Gemmata obscuriglobus UQM 2246]
MRPANQSIRATPVHATRHLRPVLTDWLGRRSSCPSGAALAPRGRVAGGLAAAFARSVAAACAAIASAPSGQAIWDCLYLAPPERSRTLERWLQPARRAPLGKRKRAARVAIDYHRTGYFGKPNRDTTRAEETGAPTRSTPTPPPASSGRPTGTPSG